MFGRQFSEKVFEIVKSNIQINGEDFDEASAGCGTPGMAGRFNRAFSQPWSR